MVWILRPATLLPVVPEPLQQRPLAGSVLGGLANARLDLAKTLLADTDIPVCDIPERCGFESPNHLMRLFKRRTGMTMLQYRKGLLR